MPEKYGPRSVEYQAEKDQEAEIHRLKAEFKRVPEERAILKKARRTSPSTTSEVLQLCQVIEVHPSG